MRCSASLCLPLSLHRTPSCKAYIMSLMLVEEMTVTVMSSYSHRAAAALRSDEKRRERESSGKHDVTGRGC